MADSALLKSLDAALQSGKLTAGAVKNIRAWLTEPRYKEYADQVAEHIRQGKWKVLDDVFWTIIPFGTGGRRGRMYPIGSNAINDRTIGESAQGLATYVQSQHTGDAPLACAIAYDTRHNSRHFAELCAEVMAGNGFHVYFLDGFRSTPELSFTVRLKKCSCGIMVTASHNPPSDNAVKAYWSTGGQLLPPHDRGVIDRVMSTDTIVRTPFAEALGSGHVMNCQQEVDTAYFEQVHLQSLPGPRELKIIYSPMHGVGAASVLPALKMAGFRDVELFAPHAEPNGDFPNVPDHVSNPEIPKTFDTMIARAKEFGTDLILSTDPDCDRLGCAAPLVPGGEWAVFTGNQIGCLLAEYLLEGRKRLGNLTSANYVIKTQVTSPMIARIAESYGVRCFGDLPVGFKWIGGLMDEKGPELFVLGCEESHGFLVGSYARDKDAAVAALLMAELAARTKSEGQTLHQKLDALYWQHGCHAEQTVSKTMPGSEGMVRMQALMDRLRKNPPAQVGTLRVLKVRDYLTLTEQEPGKPARPMTGVKNETLFLELEGNNAVAVRPSGTEPKVKFYMFAFEPPEQLANLEDAKSELERRLAALKDALFALADAD